MKKIIILIILLLSLFLYFVFNKNRNVSESFVCFSDNCIEAEIAATNQERQKGLMFKKSLPENQGMLFVFNKADMYSFWMKNTYIPLDIIWINENQVIHMEQAVPCKEDCISYKPQNPAKYILETNTGFIEKNNIQIGDKVEISL